MTSTIYVAGVAHVTLPDYLSQIAIRDERIKELMASVDNLRSLERFTAELALNRIAQLEAEIAQYKTGQGAEPVDQLYKLLDKAASLLTESALSEDYDGDEALDLVAAIRGEFTKVGKTTVENTLDVMWEKIRIAAGFDENHEFTLAEAIAKISAPPSPPIAERKPTRTPENTISEDNALRQQVIATLTAIGLPTVMMSGERACQLLRELLVAAQGIPPAIGQSIGHSIGHGEPVHDLGAEVEA